MKVALGLYLALRQFSAKPAAPQARAVLPASGRRLEIDPQAEVNLPLTEFR